MKIRTVLSLLIPITLAALAPARAATTTWTIDPNHSAAQFSVRHLMVSNVRGEFGKMSGTIVFDDQDPAHTTVEATIDATSIDTRVSARDDDLKSDSFFDVAKYPTITFKSAQVRSAGPNKYSVAGNLTMHGVTKPVTLEVNVTPPIKDKNGNQRRGAEATTKLNRKDFGVNGASAAVGDDVQVLIDFEAIHKAEAPAGK